MRFVPFMAILAGCLAGAASPAGAITDGTTDGTGHPSVGAMLNTQAYPDGTWSYCTGTLISPTVFLTAAHCGKTGQKTAMVSFSDRYRLGEDVRVGRYVPDPHHTDTSDDYDIAVVVFDTPIPGVKPAKLPTAGLLDRLAANGSLATATFTPVGFGAVSRAKGDRGKPFRYTDTRRRASMSFHKLTPNWLTLSEKTSKGDGGTCYGDSGGPNFLGGPWSDVVAATTISGEDDACRADNKDFRLDSAQARAFLGQFVRLS